MGDAGGGGGGRRLASGGVDGTERRGALVSRDAVVDEPPVLEEGVQPQHLPRALKKSIYTLKR